MTPTNEPKTAEQWTRQLCDGLNLGKTSRKAIEKTLIAYAQQEGRELVEALEYLLHDRNAIGLTISEVCSKAAFDRVETAISSWKARNQ